MSDDFTSGSDFEDNEEGLVVQMGEVEAQKFEAMPAGTYNGMISDAEFQISNSSKKPMWSVTVTVTDEGDYQNRKLFTFLSFSEKALPGTKGALETFAPELTEGNLKVNDPETVQSIIGRKVRVKVGVESYQGEDRNRIRRWMTPEDDADGFA